MGFSSSDKDEHTIHSPLSFDFQSLKLLAVGKSGIVYAIDRKRVLKEYHSDGIDIERRALVRLGSHPNIVKYLGATDNSFIFERGQPLRSLIQAIGAAHIPLERKTRWLREAAEGLLYVHDSGIIHADIGCHNMIVVDDRLKIIDFEGCSIDSEEATSCYEWFSYRESAPAMSQKTDVFAYGCAIYEVITGRQPYDELGKFEDRMQRVQKLYAENQFPETEHLPLGEVIRGCWHGTLNSMDEVLQVLETPSLPPVRRVDDEQGTVGPQSSIARLFSFLRQGVC